MPIVIPRRRRAASRPRRRPSPQKRELEDPQIENRCPTSPGVSIFESEDTASPASDPGSVESPNPEPKSEPPAPSRVIEIRPDDWEFVRPSPYSSAIEVSGCPRLFGPDLTLTSDTMAEVWSISLNTQIVQASWQRPFGKGAFGSVYSGLVEDVPVAVKIASCRAEGTERGSAYAETFSCTLRELFFGSIMVNAQYTVFPVDGGCYTLNDTYHTFVSMPLGGLNLHHVLGRHYALHGDVLSVLMRDCVRGVQEFVEATHGTAGHFDIKPGNIMIRHPFFHKDARCFACVTDFGLSRLTSGTNSDMLVSMFWRSPEILYPGVCRNTAGPETDIWSLGMMFLQMACNGSQRFWPHSDELDDFVVFVAKIIGPPTPESFPWLFERARRNRRSEEAGRLAHVLHYFRGCIPVSSKESIAGKIPESSPLYGNEMFVDLVSRMLQYEPSRRPTIAEVAEHPFFTRLDGVEGTVEFQHLINLQLGATCHPEVWQGRVRKAQCVAKEVPTRSAYFMQTDEAIKTLSTHDMVRYVMDAMTIYPQFYVESAFFCCLLGTATKHKFVAAGHDQYVFANTVLAVGSAVSNPAIAPMTSSFVENHRFLDICCHYAKSFYTKGSVRAFQQCVDTLKELKAAVQATRSSEEAMNVVLSLFAAIAINDSLDASWLLREARTIRQVGALTSWRFKSSVEDSIYSRMLLEGWWPRSASS